MAKSNNKQIIEYLNKNDRDLFTYFFETYYERIYDFVRYFISQKDACEEVVSDVFYRMIEKRALLSDVKNMESYLFVVSRNEAFKYLNKKNKEQLISIDDMPVDLSVEVNTPDDELLDKEMMKVLHEAINELPERCKLIFLMVREQKLKYKEISEMLSITEGTIEVQMNTAIKRIVTTIKKYYPNLDYHKR